MASILQTSRELARLLEANDVKLVLAESCTAGLVSASLAKVPGISQRLCGSAVTYRGETKTAWLNVSPRVLKNPGAVSDVVARKMAAGVLSITPEAHISASVTGHLGPGAPADLDGLVFVGAARRRTKGGRPRVVDVRKVWLSHQGRSARQREAALHVLEILCDILQGETA